MPTYVTCQSCGGKLRIPDDYLGRKVRCPACTFTFEAVASSPSAPPIPSGPSAAPSPTEAVFPNLSLDDSPAPAPAPTPAPASWTQACPYCGEMVRPDASRCPHCDESLDEEPDDEDDDEDRPWEGRDRRGVRRDCEPHRGTLIQVLGIISASMIPLLCCQPLIFGAIGLGLGIPAWVMGRGDLAKMTRGLKDPEGRGHTQAGMICGIVGTTLHGLVLFVYVALIVLWICLMLSGVLR